jgi:hypothetical protein
MNISYERIVEVNKGVTYTNVKGKNYAEVAQRVQAFRNLIPDGYITTDIISLEDGVVYMKAECGYYAEDGRRVMLATGLAFERQDASNLNKTSFIENCETSAIGRCLGFVGIGSEKSIASAEEVAHAIETQEAIESGAIPDPAKVRRAVTAQVTQAAQLPTNPVLEYLAKEREALRVVREMSKAENNALWKAQIKALTDAGIIPNKPLADFTMQEAENMVKAMYANFTPTGTEMKPHDGKTS